MKLEDSSGGHRAKWVLERRRAGGRRSDRTGRGLCDTSGWPGMGLTGRGACGQDVPRREGVCVAIDHDPGG
jgi:hypothetical protein